VDLTTVGTISGNWSIDAFASSPPSLTVGGHIVKVGDISNVGTRYKGNTNIRSIGNITGDVPANAFEGCEKLEEVGNITGNLGNYAFTGCTKLATVGNIEGNVGTNQYNFEYADTKIEYANTPRYSVLKLNTSPFNGCINLNSVGDVCEKNTRCNMAIGVFKGCNNLKEVGKIFCNVPDSAFSDCTSLEKVDLHSVLGEIRVGQNAFKGCIALTDIGDTATEKMTVTIGSFSGCKLLAVQLKKVLFKTNGYRAFAGCESLISVGEINASDIATTVGNAVFSGCTSLRSVGYTWKDFDFDKVFHRCVNIRTVNGITYGLGDIDGNVTANKYKLNKNIRYVGNISGNVVDSAFYDCSNLVAVGNISGNVGDSAFRSCKNLLKVGHIGGDAGAWSFSYCEALLDVGEITGTEGNNIYTYSALGEPLQSVKRLADGTNSNSNPDTSVFWIAVQVFTLFNS